MNGADARTEGAQHTVQAAIRPTVADGRPVAHAFNLLCWSISSPCFDKEEPNTSSNLRCKKNLNWAVIIRAYSAARI
jgi:hypothetical protein